MIVLSPAENLHFQIERRQSIVVEPVSIITIIIIVVIVVIIINIMVIIYVIIIISITMINDHQ